MNPRPEPRSQPIPEVLEARPYVPVVFLGGDYVEGTLTDPPTQRRSVSAGPPGFKRENFEEFLQEIMALRIMAMREQAR